jgi:hypothetical protein
VLQAVVCDEVVRGWPSGAMATGGHLPSKMVAASWLIRTPSWRQPADRERGSSGLRATIATRLLAPTI